VQQPASAVAVSLMAPKEHYQRVSGLQSFSSSLVTVLTPAFATALFAFAGLDAVLAFDIVTCAVALVALGFFIRIPAAPSAKKAGESVLQAARGGLSYLKRHRGILDLILFLAAINFTASMYNAALPAMLLSRAGGGQTALGLVNTFTGLATLAGSLVASIAPAPKSRVRTILYALLFSMSTENLLLALGRGAPVWCFAAVLGWIFIPVMGANMNALFISYIPIDMQGRVFSARNSLQFFTIPLGYFAGGALVDSVFEPLMARQTGGSALIWLLGAGKGSGAALLFLIMEIVGVVSCLFFMRDRHIWALER
jgi:predicted MFS family arabinose efflux permease